ncbi:hypothetical protein [Gymnodinialimonas hymeniacidonis]|uniref:hypothetical protein n=1 Tax=Gymnodinialimonas hymeniacidonis TaxID=3126508 RepID=UPI0034C6604A
MKSIFLSALTALTISLAAATPSTAQQNTTGWLPHHDYQYFFDEGFYQPLVPIQVDAAVINGQVHYHATFGPAPGGVNNWATHHGMSDSAFVQRNLFYQNQGYYLRQQSRVVHAGQAYNQGVWYR